MSPLIFVLDVLCHLKELLLEGHELGYLWGGLEASEPVGFLLLAPGSRVEFKLGFPSALVDKCLNALDDLYSVFTFVAQDWYVL